jgi:phosphate transport system protein
MAEHLERAVNKLKKKILSLCANVEENLWKSVKSVEKRDQDMAEDVIASDINIDQMEVDVEEECLKILALYQPVATDLRFIITCLKINNDLERIGDLAVNIAERGMFLASHPIPVTIPFDFSNMAEKTQNMLRKSLNALVNMDKEIAKEVCDADDQIDAINRDMYNLIKQFTKSNPELIEHLIHLLSISRHLERIADHTTNIAEDVIYMVEGRIVRHSAESYQL